MSSYVRKAAGKAKERIRDRVDRRSRPPPRPPAPRVSLKSIEDSFEKILDRPDEVSNPLFNYTVSSEPDTQPAEEQQQTEQEPSARSEGARDLFSRDRAQAAENGGEEEEQDLFPDHLHVGDPLTGQIGPATRSVSPPSPSVNGQEEQEGFLGAPPSRSPEGGRDYLDSSADSDHNDVNLSGSSDSGLSPSNFSPGEGSLQATDDDELFKSALSVLQAHYASFDVDHSSGDESAGNGYGDSDTHIPPDPMQDVYPHIPSVDELLEHGIRPEGFNSPLSSSPEREQPLDSKHPPDLVAEADQNKTPTHRPLSSSTPEPPSQPEQPECTALPVPVTAPHARSSPVNILTPGRAPSDPLELTEACEHPLSLNGSINEPEWPLRDPTDSGGVKQDDLIPICEDHFGSSSSSKPASDRNRAPQLLKTNSVGKAAPPRPPVSPKLREKLKKQSQSVPSRVGRGKGLLRGPEKETATTKVVRPLGHAPPELTHRGNSLIHRGLPGKAIHHHSPVSASSPSSKFPVLESRKSPSRPGQPLREAASKANQKEKPVELSIKKDLLFEESRATPSAVPELEDLLPPLPPQNHLMLAGLLYLYYSLNVFPYLSGLVSGFFLFFLTVGAVFIYYAHYTNGSHGSSSRERPSMKLDDDFVRKTHVNFQQLKYSQSNKFTATFQYNPATHHPNSRFPVEIVLEKNSNLTVKYKSAQGAVKTITANIHDGDALVRLVPREVFENRKRRWSKKFPIEILNSQGTIFTLFLFAPTSRKKEEWYRRLRAASEGIPAESQIANMRDFFGYMQHYFPTSSLPHPPTRRVSPSPFSSSSTHHHEHHHRRNHGRSQASSRSSSTVQFSNRPESEDGDLDEDTSAVVITKQPRSVPMMSSQRHSFSPPESMHPGLRQSSHSGASSLTSSLDTAAPPPAQPYMTNAQHSSPRSGSDDGFELVSAPLPLPRAPRETDWINVLAARLCWDVWHEERWRTWVHNRIQRKLIRVKTPSFMEQLRVTDVQVGRDMPTINHLYAGPELKLDGVWVYLDITYQGSFVMTIETKLKMGVGVDGEDKVVEEQEQPMSLHTARMKDAEENEIDSGSDDEGTTPIQQFEEEGVQSPRSPHPHSPLPHSPSSHSPRPARTKLRSMVTRITKTMAKSKFVRKAAEKVCSYPLVLTVEVKRLDGILAVNIPPPPADTIWYGFKGNPHLHLVAKPKLGQREVTLHQVTSWIEKKLRELVEKKLVLPNMEDLVIPILNSGLPEDKDQISSLTSPTAGKDTD